MKFPENLTDMLAHAQKLQQDMARMQEEAAKKEVEGSAGGGMVTVKVNGKFEVLAVRIEPSVVNPGEVPMLQDLVQSACNVALRNAREAMKEEMGKLTGGISIPGFLGNLFGNT